MIIVCAGINFIVELLLNLFLTPALIRVTRAIEGAKGNTEDQKDEEE